MDKCVYNGKIITSFEVSESFDFETEIRSCKELKCCDPECNSPVIYKHGAIRAPYFAHLTNNSCSYDEYSREKTGSFKKIQKQLFDLFNTKYPNEVEIDVKLIKEPSHYTSIVLNFKSKRFAVDITDKTFSANVLSERKDTYQHLGYEGLQIILDTAYNCDLGERNDLYYSVKFELNRSQNNIAVVADKETGQFCYMKLDTNKYDGALAFLNSRDLFARYFDLSELSVGEDGFCVPRLDKEYAYWLSERQNKQIEYIKQLENNKNEENDSKPTEASKPALKEKKAFDYTQFHKNTGRYAGDFRNGRREDFALEDIRINKKAPNYMGIFTDEKMEQTINDAFDFSVSSIRKLLYKMYHANYYEKAVFVRIYEEYLNAEQNYENAERLKILEYVIEEAEVFNNEKTP